MTSKQIESEKQVMIKGNAFGFSYTQNIYLPFIADEVEFKNLNVRLDGNSYYLFLKSDLPIISNKFGVNNGNDLLFSFMADRNQILNFPLHNLTYKLIPTDIKTITIRMVDVFIGSGIPFDFQGVIQFILIFRKYKS